MYSPEALYKYYQANSELIWAKQFSIIELEEMLPFERYIYVEMYNQKVEDKANKGK